MEYLSSFLGGFIGAIIGVLIICAIAFRFGGGDD